MVDPQKAVITAMMAAALQRRAAVADDCEASTRFEPPANGEQAANQTSSSIDEDHPQRLCSHHQDLADGFALNQLPQARTSKQRSRYIDFPDRKIPMAAREAD